MSSVTSVPGTVVVSQLCPVMSHHIMVRMSQFRSIISYESMVVSQPLPVISYHILVVSYSYVI